MNEQLEAGNSLVEVSEPTVLDKIKYIGNGFKHYLYKRNQRKLDKLLQKMEKDSNLVKHARIELEAQGIDFNNKGDIDTMLADSVIRLLQTFSTDGHSGTSAPFAIQQFTRLAEFKPLGPLTGEDSEWQEVEGGMYQNKRCSSVFKDTKTGEVYNIDGIVFYDWYTDEETGEKYKSHYTCSDSRVPVTFPYVVPAEPEYRETPPEH